MAYNILHLQNLTELKLRVGGTTSPTLATILGIDYPEIEAFAVYVWDNASLAVSDDYEIVTPNPRIGMGGRWFRVDLAVTPHTHNINQITNLQFELNSKLETETDPTVPQFVKNISSNDIQNWEEAYSWGDHSNENYATENWVNNKGYLTSYENTVTRAGTSNADLSSGDLIFSGSGDTSVIKTGNTITVYSKDSQYTAGNGITLTDYDFSIPLTVTGTGNFVQNISVTPDGISVEKSTPVNTTYTSTNGITLSGTNFSPVYGNTAGTIAQGNDVRINNGALAYTWGNHSGKYKTLDYQPMWEEVLDKPTTFTPSVHSHTVAEVTNLQTALDGKISIGASIPYSTITGAPDAQIQADWNQTDNTKKDFIKNKPAKTFNNNVSRALNTNFTISNTRDAMVNYSINLSVTNPLIAGSSVANAFLEYSLDSGTNWNTVSEVTNASSVALAVTIALTQPNKLVLSGLIPANSLVRIRTATTGTATITFARGQEVFI